MKNITMDKKDFVKEHKRIVKILKSGSKKQQVKEANAQKNELKRRLAKNK